MESLMYNSLVLKSDSCSNIILYVYCLQLIVGSEDFDIRVFREDEILAEMTETEVRIMFHYD